MEYRNIAGGAIDPVEREVVEMNFKLPADPKRCMRVTAPLWACDRFSPACLIRKDEMARLTTCKTGESRWGWLANRYRSGIGNDNTHWRTGTRGMT